MGDHKVAVITGANGNLGTALAYRLIKRLPDDTRITFIVTSRTLPGVKEAVDKIKNYVEENPRKGLVEFDYVIFDQLNMVSVLAAAYDMKKRHKHIDYLFLNSSFAQFVGVDYVRALKDFFLCPVESFTIGTMKLQASGKISDDEMGAVFQANVLAPWFFINEIKPLLQNGGRVIFISSSISSPDKYDAEDLELIKCKTAYEVSKYELELLQQSNYQKWLKDYGIQLWLVQPGVFESTTYVPTLSMFSYLAMLFMFYFCRLCGSPYHVIWPKSAANAPIWAALDADPKKNDMTIKYGSASNMIGSEVLMQTPMPLDQAHVKQVGDYVDSKTKQWHLRLKDQILERNLY